MLPVTQLGLPNFTSQSVVTDSAVGVTGACYATPAAASAGLTPFATDCANSTDGCNIGTAVANSGPIACPSGTRTYSVMQSVYTPATGGSASTSTTGTAVTTSAASNGYYNAATDVAAGDHGSLTCPAASGNTTYACTYTVGAAIGSNSPLSSSAATSACYSGVGTATNNWNPATSTDHGSLACPANGGCSYAGAMSTDATGCIGQRRKVTVTQTFTPKRQFTINQSAVPTTVTSGSGGTPA